MVVAYARVSTNSQDYERQLLSLKKNGFDKIYSEKISGTKKNRPQLEKLKDFVRPGDTVLIESLSRLGRSVEDVIELINFFEDKNISLVSLKENISDKDAMGKFIRNTFININALERDIISQRTKEAMQVARNKNIKLGRPKKSQKDLDTAMKMYESGSFTYKEIQMATSVSKATLYRYLKANRE